MMNVKLEKRWQLTHKPFTHKTMLVQCFDPSMKRFAWYVLNIKGGKTSPLTEYFESELQHTLFAVHTKALFFVSEHGVERFNIGARSSEVLLPVDREQYVIKGLWLSPNEHVLFYLRYKISPSRSNLVRKAIESGIAPFSYTEASLMEIPLNTGKEEELYHWSSSPPHRCTLSNDCNTLYAATGTKIVKISLDGGASKILKKHQSAMLIQRTGDGRILIWNINGSAIEEIVHDDNVVPMSTFGLTPSLSSNGRWLGFFYENSLYLKEFPDDPIRIAAASEKSFWGDPKDQMIWCYCGGHFAVRGPQRGRAEKDSDVLIGDAANRTVMVVPVRPYDLLWVT